MKSQQAAAPATVQHQLRIIATLSGFFFAFAYAVLLADKTWELNRIIPGTIFGLGLAICMLRDPRRIAHPSVPLITALLVIALIVHFAMNGASDNPTQIIALTLLLLLPLLQLKFAKLSKATFRS